MSHSSCNHSLTHWKINRWYPIWSVMNKAAVNICVQVSWEHMSSLLWNTWWGRVKLTSHDSFMVACFLFCFVWFGFWFLRNCQAFQSDCILHSPHTTFEGSSFFLPRCIIPGLCLRSSDSYLMLFLLMCVSLLANDTMYSPVPSHVSSHEKSFPACHPFCLSFRDYFIMLSDCPLSET